MYLILLIFSQVDRASRTVSSIDNEPKPLTACPLNGQFPLILKGGSLLGMVCLFGGAL